MNTAQMQIIVLAASATPRSGSPGKAAPDQDTPSLPLVLSRAAAVAGHAVSVVLGAHAAEIAPGL